MNKKELIKNKKPKEGEVKPEVMLMSATKDLKVKSPQEAHKGVSPCPGPRPESARMIRLMDFYRKHQLEMDAIGETGVTALMRSTQATDCERLRFLILRGARLDQQDQEGWTAARWAVARSNVSALKILGHAGADLNLPDMFGDSPLMAGSGDRGCKATVQALLDAGVDMDLRGHDGLRAVELAQMHKKVDIEALLKAYEQSKLEKEAIDKACEPARCLTKKMSL